MATGDDDGGGDDGDDGEDGDDANAFPPDGLHWFWISLIRASEQQDLFSI